MLEALQKNSKLQHEGLARLCTIKKTPPTLVERLESTAYKIENNHDASLLPRYKWLLLCKFPDNLCSSEAATR
jgi:hypothetical protein